MLLATCFGLTVELVQLGSENKSNLVISKQLMTDINKLLLDKLLKSYTENSELTDENNAFGSA